MTRVANLRGLVWAGALVLALSACSGDGNEDEVTFTELPVDVIYNDAMDFLDGGDAVAAASAFEEVERQHPYSQWAVRAQLMAAYSYYRANLYDDAIASANRFIDLHPGNPDVPYARYLIGISYYEQISDVGRDQKMTEDALAAFDDLTRRYPETDYARDAALKADLARDHLAGKEMEIGRYYQEREAYVAAINRFRSVVERYQTTTHVPEALHRLTECYLALGVVPEAEKTASVLGYNYPGSRWYQDSYALLVDDAPPSDEVPYWKDGPPPEETDGLEGGADGQKAEQSGQRAIFDWPDWF